MTRSQVEREANILDLRLFNAHNDLAAFKKHARPVEQSTIEETLRGLRSARSIVRRLMHKEDRERTQ